MITKEQWNYWTLLVDLHCGATWPAMRPEDIDYPSFREHYEFAAKYAGYTMEPEKSPGAWIAFREGDWLVGDYSFLMERRSIYNEVKRRSFFKNTGIAAIAAGAFPMQSLSYRKEGKTYYHHGRSPGYKDF